MTLTEFIKRVNYALRGTDDEVPTLGDDDWKYWTSLLNRKKDELVDEKNYASNFNRTAPNEPGTVATTAASAVITGTGTNFTDYRVGDKFTVSGETEKTILSITSDTVMNATTNMANTATAKTFTHKNIVAVGVQSYYLHRSFTEPSDHVSVLDTNGQYHYFDIIKPQERVHTTQNCWISGRNPKKVTFEADLSASDSIVGGTLHVPGYYRPDDVLDTDANAVIPMDDPNYGVMAVAAQVAFNDIEYDDKFADLNGQANELLKQMNRRNRRGTYGNPRQSPTRVTRIPGFR